MKKNLARFRKLKAELAKINRKDVAVGVLGTDAADDRGGITQAELAAVHEFGSPDRGIPERSFLRSTFESVDTKRLQKNFTARVMRAIVRGKLTPEQGVDNLGEWGVLQVRNAITVGEGISPANAEATIAKKGSSRPLVDTGSLVQSISHEVK